MGIFIFCGSVKGHSKTSDTVLSRDSAHLWYELLTDFCVSGLIKIAKILSFSVL